jgi:hypothetical protein
LRKDEGGMSLNCMFDIQVGLLPKKKIVNSEVEVKDPGSRELPCNSLEECNILITFPHIQKVNSDSAIFPQCVHGI